jgi:hypothetical protein
LARKQHAAWKSHLRRSYSEEEARALLASWAREDTYVPLETELALLRQSGFTTEVLWRKEVFAVLQARR